MEAIRIALERLDGNLPEALMAEWLYRSENEDFLVGFIEDHLGEEASREPMKF